MDILAALLCIIGLISIVSAFEVDNDSRVFYISSGILLIFFSVAIGTYLRETSTNETICVDGQLYEKTSEKIFKKTITQCLTNAEVNRVQKENK